MIGAVQLGNTKLEPAIELLTVNTIMEYDWGSSDSLCLINQLRQQGCKRYAELWMGTHKNGPSMLNSQQSLLEYLNKRGFGQLPFLFKLLCIEKALSIQLHPNKQQAEKLFATKPHIYGDDNEKPEMFYTLTQFECFLGIIGQEELSKLMGMAPFSRLHSRGSLSIKLIIKELLQIPQLERAVMIKQLIINIGGIFPEREGVIKRLESQFGNDSGLLVSCLLQYLILPQGQCFGIEAGLPHAYLSGSCLQIMKSSDNVVRLGLTPKLKDTETMLQIMQDILGQTAFRVDVNQTEGFVWNHFSILPISVEQQKERKVIIKYISIAVVFEGELVTVAPFKFAAIQGAVVVITPGQYTLIGPVQLYIGSYQL